MAEKSNFSVRTRRSAEILLIFIVLFSGLLLGFSGGGFVLNFNRIGFSAVSILQKGVGTVISGATGIVAFAKDSSSLRKEVLELSKKLEDYEYMQRNNTEIRKENERLKEQLDFAEKIEYKNISARIIGRDPNNLYSGITINKGSRSGVKKGQPVIAIQNGNTGVVGKVVTVGRETSLVMPLYDVKCNISSRVQNTRDIGIVSGNGSYSSPLNLQYIRKRAFDDLNKGDIIVTSGESDNYIADIPIGRISDIKVLDYDSSLYIEVEPEINFFRLEHVLVVDQKSANEREPSSSTEVTY